MNAKRKVEVFSAGCSVCDETVAMVRRMACADCEVMVLDLHDAGVSRFGALFIVWDPSGLLATPLQADK